MRHNIYHQALSLCLAFIFTSIGAAAETNMPQPSQHAKTLAFSHIATAVSALQTISSDFVQERHASMLKTPLISEGKFFYEKPDRLYWESTRPSVSGFTVSGGTAKRWAKDQSSAEAFMVENDPIARTIVEQVFAWTRADFTWLEKRYAITVTEDAPARLTLVPRISQEKKYLSHLNISFSSNWNHVTSVEIHEKGGDYTRIMFLRTLVNQPLPPGFFAQ